MWSSQRVVSGEELRLVVMYFWPDNSPLWLHKILVGTILWYNMLMSKKYILLISVLSLISIMFFLNYTSPSEIGPFGVLLFFLALYVFLFGVSFLLVCLMRVILKGRKRSKKLDYLYSVMLAFGPIILLLMRAFEMFNLGSVAMAVLFVVLGCFLVKKKVNVVE